MSDFDPNFERIRLAMLASQYPEIVKKAGEVIFWSENIEHGLSLTRWKTEEYIYKKANKSGFKVHLIELLSNFTEYRRLCNELPNNEGTVSFGEGEINIKWLPDGSTELSGDIV